MGTVRVNGVSYSGNSINITNGRIFVDGIEVETDQKNIKIEVSGDVQLLQADACDSIIINGKVGPIKTVSGDVHVKDSVVGNINTVSGNVTCTELYGSTNTVSGNIIQRA
jgi:hypothetical protein